MVSALDTSLRGLGLSPGRALRCVLGQDTLLSYIKAELSIKAEIDMQVRYVH